MTRFLNLFLAGLLLLPAAGLAADSEEAMMQQLQKQIQDLSEELDELNDRLNKTERHSALDRIEFTGDLRQKVDSLKLDDVTVNQGFMVDFQQLGQDVNNAVMAVYANPMEFPGPPASGFNPPPATDPNAGITQADVDNYWDAYSLLTEGFPAMAAQFPEFAQAFAMGQLPAKGFFGTGVQKSDHENEVLYTSRLRLNMAAKIYQNMKFSGRLTMYKNWGDSTGVKVFDSFDSFTMDGTNSGNTTGDLLHVERAYFDWSDIGGSNFYLSIGRRPSTYGYPTNLRENELRGGTPSGHVVNFNFDGITAGYHLEDATGIPGFTARFCYGQGFEAEYGNGSLFAEPDVKDTHLGGFNIDLYNDGYTVLQTTIFRAWDIADSFKGLAVMPFADHDGDGIPDDMNNNAYISRFQGQADIGDMYLGSLTFIREEMSGFTWFGSLGWTRTKPSAAFNPMGLGGLLYDASPVMRLTAINVNDDGTVSPEFEHTGDYVKSDDWDKDRDGWSVYVGFQTPAPLGKFGLEYNYGSEFWSPFTQAQDDVMGSKLATRGHVGEAYYIFEINPRAFIKVGALYYDYEYTGSGSPVGRPKKVEDVQDGKEFSLLPVLDKVWDLNASVTMKF
ncbi:MAG TPA: DUF3373 family protein [Desulfuromonadales bacterium]|nr:DUF3373 family protein [Desulfuromonadales bacterium]